MNIENVIPAVHIIIDPEVNVSVIKKFHEDNKTGVTIKDDNSKNSIGITKAIDATASIFSNNRRSPIETLKAVFEENTPFLDHFVYGVLFNNISQRMINSLYAINLKSIKITEDPALNSSKFWLPPAFQSDTNSRDAFGEAFIAFQTLRIRLIEEFGITKDEDLRSLMTDSFAKNAVMSAGIYDWIQLLLHMTSFSMYSENRFVFMMLYLKLYDKSPVIFSYIKLRDASGQVFGVDTLRTNPDLWYKYSLAIVL